MQRQENSSKTITGRLFPSVSCSLALLGNWFGRCVKQDSGLDGLLVWSIRVLLTFTSPLKSIVRPTCCLVSCYFSPPASPKNWIFVIHTLNPNKVFKNLNASTTEVLWFDFWCLLHWEEHELLPRGLQLCWSLCAEISHRFWTCAMERLAERKERSSHLSVFP